MTFSIHPHEIAGLLDRFPAAQCLSLDCFDTLLWRDCHAPSDLFAMLPNVSKGQRADAERRARKAQQLRDGSTEISISQIYERLMPNATPDEHAKAIAAELAAEARHCFGFTPTIQLMREAHSRGIPIIIVSDTYCDEVQLSTLIAKAAGQDVADLIDAIYCSSTHGVSKGDGLYRTVLKKRKCAPQSIVHLGDNSIADVAAIAPLGVQAVHLLQFSDSARKLQRLEAGVDALVHSADADMPRPLQPHRAALALGMPQLDDPAQQLGASMLGPLLHAFDQWLRNQAEALGNSHKGKVHWLFLMRDGHLPQRIHEARGAEANSHAAELSRFTATAAHFSQKGALARFVEEEIGQRPQSLARQLLIGDERIESLLGDCDIVEGSKLLLKETRSGSFQKATMRTARGYADRLEAHIRQLCDPAPGDVLMLVDLGYNGTAQNRTAALLEQRLGAHVAGRYLLMRERDCPGLDKRGLIDAEHYSPELLEAMCANVALLEQLCSKACGSVVDYEADGTPVRRANDIKQAQSEVREAVQDGAIAFQHWAAEAITRPSEAHALQQWREAAASVLMRSMYLPLTEELCVVEQFQHDVNLGTERTVPLFDRQAASDGLRQRGLFYMNGSERMYLPAEIEGEGMDVRLSLLAHRRFNLPFTYADCAGDSIDLPVFFKEGDQLTRRIVQATPTHAGYFTAAIPIGKARFAVAPQLAELCEWFELERMCFVPVGDFVSGNHEELRTEIEASAQVDGMTMLPRKLVHCPDEDGQMIIPPPSEGSEEPLLLALTFRPLVARKRAQIAATTADERLSA